MTMPSLRPRRPVPHSTKRTSHWDANRDPLGFQAGDSNLFRYVGNGPTNAVDPSGLEIDFNWSDRSNDGISDARRREIENRIRQDFEDMKKLGGVIGNAAEMVCPTGKPDKPFDLPIIFEKGAVPFANYPGRGGPKRGVTLDPSLIDEAFIPEDADEGEMPYGTKKYPNAARWIIYMHEFGHIYPGLDLRDPIPRKPLGMNLMWENICRDQLKMKPRRTYNDFNPPFWKMPENPPGLLFPRAGYSETPKGRANQAFGRIKAFIERSR